jgi:four helix bundle protein
MEAETQILLCERLEYLDNKMATTLLEQGGEVGRILNGLMRSLEKSCRPN